MLDMRDREREGKRDRQGVRQDCESTHTGQALRGISKWQPTQVFLPGESQRRGSLMGCCLWGRTESDMTEGTCRLAEDVSDGEINAQCCKTQYYRGILNVSL